MALYARHLQLLLFDDGLQFEDFHLELIDVDHAKSRNQVHDLLALVLAALRIVSFLVKMIVHFHHSSLELHRLVFLFGVSDTLAQAGTIQRGVM